MARRSRLASIGQTNANWQEVRSSNARLAYERRIVRKLLGTVGIGPLEVRTKYGPQWKGADNEDFFLTFGWMHQEFSRFPLRLMPLLPDPSKEAVVSADEFFFPRSKLWKQWKEVEDVMEDCGLPYGAVCSTGSRLGDMVIHTYDDRHKPLDKVQFAFVRSNPEGGCVLMERLDLFSRRISDVWKT